jgi:hypothetical protein
MLATMSFLPEAGLGSRTWSQDGLVGLELEEEPSEARAPAAAPLWEACIPPPREEGSPPRSRARCVRFAVDETAAQPLFSSHAPKRPIRRLTSAERLDLARARPDLDVRNLPWARRQAAQRRRRAGLAGRPYLRIEDAEPETPTFFGSWGGALWASSLDVVGDLRAAITDAVDASGAVDADDATADDGGLWATSHAISDIFLV